MKKAPKTIQKQHKKKNRKIQNQKEVEKKS